MKSRLSASLMAGVCTVCIAASSGTVAPQSVAAPPAATTISVVSARYELTASTTALTPANAQLLADLLNVAGLPLANLTTIINTSSALTAILFLPNTVYTLVVTGKSDQIPQAIQDAIAKEKAAFQTFFKLPQSIVATDVAAFQKLFADFAAPTTGLAATSVKSAAVTPVATPSVTHSQQVFADFLNVAGLPLANITTVINAGSALTAILFLPNTIYTLAVTDKSDQIPQAIQDAITKEKAAFKTFAALPKTIVATDVAAVKKLFSDFKPVVTVPETSKSALTSKSTKLALTSATPADTTTTDPTPKTPVRHLFDHSAKTSSKKSATKTTDTTTDTSTSTATSTTSTTTKSKDDGGGYVGKHRAKVKASAGAGDAS